jgi:transposase
MPAVLATGSINPSALSLAGHTAPYSPELNPVEQLWQQIKQRFLSNTTFQNYDDVIERSCQAWNEILSEDGFIKNLCSREWSFLV